MIDYKRVHCIGIGGIHVSAVAKLLKAGGVSVSGSDAAEHELTNDLRKAGFDVKIGHGAENVGKDVEVVVFSHAVPEDNPELVEAKKRGIGTYDTHAFLAKMFKGRDQIVVTGTHGKSTTTAMLGAALMAVKANPTVVVGTKCSVFSDGNLQIGSEDLLIVEGDEYRRHVLEYDPKILVLNNVEFDHPDAFADMDAYAAMFRELIGKVRTGGVIVFNADDERCAGLVKSELDSLKEREGSVISVGRDAGMIRFAKPHADKGRWASSLKAMNSEYLDFELTVPGEMNVRNAAMAITAAVGYDVDANPGDIAAALEKFPGCWRRFERVGSLNGAIVISDYGHHPTEIKETLKAARAAYPDRRIVLCYQPHHRNRTKGLFGEFVTAFDGADALLMSEIYDVPGRESKEDADVSSSQIVEAIKKNDPDRAVEFVGDLASTEKRLRGVIRPGDLVLLMGAGTIDGVARRIVASP
jgi:UDP-N-acetylmuramate--alanine ligase